MKRLLIVRFPKTIAPENMEGLAGKIRSFASDQFIVLFIGDNVDKTEFEIVYDPHFKADQISMDQEGVRQHIQVDTSTSAYMEGKP